MHAVRRFGAHFLKYKWCTAKSSQSVAHCVVHIIWDMHAKNIHTRVLLSHQ